MVSRVAAPVVALLALAVLAPVVRAQETPRHGGELVFVVPAESPSWKLEAATRAGGFGRSMATRPSTVTVVPSWRPSRSITDRPSGL